MLSSYSNQSIDSPTKLIDWFLYNGSIRFKWVKRKKTLYKVLADISQKEKKGNSAEERK